MSLAMAESLQAEALDRSVLYLYFTCEEQGLLDSAYYTSAPAVPLRRVVGVVNLDAGAPPATRSLAHCGRNRFHPGNGKG